MDSSSSSDESSSEESEKTDEANEISQKGQTEAEILKRKMVRVARSKKNPDQQEVEMIDTSSKQKAGNPDKGAKSKVANEVGKKRVRNGS